MHRSGTSCLVGSLQQAGLQLGKYHSWNRYNQKGNRENQDIVDFHEELLAATGASWDSPPARLQYGAADISRALGLIEKYAAQGPWGFKDPRTLLSLELWREAAPELRPIGIFRHPRAVAESLRRRSGGRIATEQALSLWLHYNELLYRAWEGERFPVLCFDWDKAEFQHRLALVIAKLDLPGYTGEQPFYSSELLHFQGGPWEGIPRRLRRLYEKLAEASESRDAS
jgi:hypothetical protein